MSRRTVCVHKEKGNVLAFQGSVNSANLPFLAVLPKPPHLCFSPGEGGPPGSPVNPYSPSPSRLLGFLLGWEEVLSGSRKGMKRFLLSPFGLPPSSCAGVALPGIFS